MKYFSGFIIRSSKKFIIIRIHKPLIDSLVDLFNWNSILLFLKIEFFNSLFCFYCKSIDEYCVIVDESVHFLGTNRKDDAYEQISIHYYSIIC